MSMPETYAARRPWWFGCVCVLACVPAFFMPFMEGMEEVRAALGKLFTYFPVYVCASALCAWLSYGRKTYVAWILIGVLALSYLSIWLLYRSYGL
ncbi:MAG: hypothetical protein K2L96_07775 [Muribaculaceae bacterium]|nr:hypothetical protein [Muribaculaceae bacterium]